LLLMPLLRQHRILAQVAGHDLAVIKLLPPLVIDDADIAWIEDAFDQVLSECEHLGGLWELGRTLADHARRARSVAA
jgi:ornithine--oxo-acid transaminase